MDAPSLQLAALLCSRLCHDLISPIGAIVNGTEVMRDETDAEMRDTALTLIEASANQASARLQYARLAFGAAGSAGSEIDLEEARDLVANMMAKGKAELDWQIGPGLAPKDTVKLLLNLVLIAVDCIPRGGRLTVAGTPGSGGELSVVAAGPKAKLGTDIREALSGAVPLEALESRQIQPAFTGFVAQAQGAKVSWHEGDERVVLGAGLRTA